MTLEKNYIHRKLKQFKTFSSKIGIQDKSHAQYEQINCFKLWYMIFRSLILISVLYIFQCLHALVSCPLLIVAL